MRWLAIAFALVFAGCDATFEYTEPTDTGTGETAPATCVTKGCLSPLQCDTETGICERCIVDGDCAEDKPRCQLDIHQCVRCNDAFDCGGPDEQCIDHHCVERCSAAVPFCMMPMTHCDPDHGICVQCPDFDHPCMLPRSLCATSYGRCEECLTNDDCPRADHHFCQLSRHSCVECLHASDCKDPSRPQCTYDNHCVP
ncbi:MAG: hypothetical protein ACXWUG_28390 [Polyangiales bacterium]